MKSDAEDSEADADTGVLDRPLELPFTPGPELRVEYRTVDSLIPYAKNARKHTPAQVAVIAGSIRAFGFNNPVGIDGDNGILTGHGRVLAARKLGMDTVPVIELAHLSPAEKQAYIIADNRSAELATWDRDLLTIELTDLKLKLPSLDVTGFNALDLDDMAGDDTAAERKKEQQEAAPGTESIVFALRESALLPSSNKWGIPDLRADMLATVVPTKVWGGGAFPQDPDDYVFVHTTASFDSGLGGGTLAFYVDDWRFEATWWDAVKTIDRFRKCGFTACITPDFSVWQDDPVAVRLWNIYRARWVARYWQEVGMRVIPSLAWGNEETMEFCNLGIPKGVPVASFQCRTTKGRRNKADFVQGFGETLDAIEPETILIYGGHENRHWIEPILPTGPHYVYLTSWGFERQSKRKEKHHGGTES